MTEQPAESVAPPVPSATRRRRIVKRLLIAICVLGLLCGAAQWVLSPRVDQRLIGTWHFAQGGPTSPPSVLTFDGDGDGIFRPLRPSPLQPFRWDVDNNRLVLTPSDIPLTERVVILVSNVIFRRRGTPDDGVFDVTSISENEVLLDAIGKDGTKTGMRWHLHRAKLK